MKVGKIPLICAVVVMAAVIIGVVIMVIPEEEVVHPNVNPMVNEVNPDDYSYINYTSDLQAITRANSQLMNMSVGGIQALSNIANITNAKFFVDNTMGGVLYWEITDGEITVRLDACTGEIITYSKVTETDGPYMTANQVMNIADNLANQFHQLPNDKDFPSIRTEVVSEILSYNPDTDVTTVDENGYHILRYNRTKSGVIASDHIEIWTFQDGNISFYYKNWNMDLDQFTVTFTLSSQEASTAALNFIGEHCTVMQTYKMILRPNGFWDEDDTGDYSWGQPVCAWVVWIRNQSGDLCIIHVNANNGEVVGGDYLEEYYK